MRKMQKEGEKTHQKASEIGLQTPFAKKRELTQNIEAVSPVCCVSSFLSVWFLCLFFQYIILLWLILVYEFFRFFFLLLLLRTMPRINRTTAVPDTAIRSPYFSSGVSSPVRT